MTDTIPLNFKKLSTQTIYLLVIGGTVVTVGILALLYYIPWITLTEDFFILTEQWGAWGNVLLIIGFIVISFPFTFGYIPLSLGAGYLYGIWMGTMTAIVGSNLGAIMCFLLVRRLLRPFCITHLANIPQAHAFIGDGNPDSINFTTATLWRFAPIPFGFSNALFALSSIPTGRYCVTTIIGLMPFQVMWVFLGTTLRSLTDVATGNLEEGSTVQTVSLALQLFAAIVLPIYMCVRSLRKKSTPSEHDIDLEAAEINEQVENI